ncbi:MAG: sigma-70 family RNA polymerase sigma factor [Isosphaeraceae bacterium]|nr:sigma-70 family RNA polymerase sigma factor [Isosphaeraceae bacterium]
MSARPYPPDGSLAVLTAPFPSILGGDALERVCAYLDDLRRGDEPTDDACKDWDQFYQHVDPLIRGLAARRLPAADCTDCTQQVWLVIVRRLRRFRPNGGNLRAWLAVLTRRAAADLLHQRAKRGGGGLTDVDEDALHGREPDPAASYERRRTTRQVHETLDRLAHRLSPLTFRVLYLRWVEGETTAQVAAQTGLTEAQVYDRHLYAKRAFKELWKTSHRENTILP